VNIGLKVWSAGVGNILYSLMHNVNEKTCTLQMMSYEYQLLRISRPTSCHEISIALNSHQQAAT